MTAYQPSKGIARKPMRLQLRNKVTKNKARKAWMK